MTRPAGWGWFKISAEARRTQVQPLSIPWLYLTSCLLAKEVDDTKRLLGEFHQDKYLLKWRSTGLCRISCILSVLEKCNLKNFSHDLKGWTVIVFILSLLFPTKLYYEFLQMENDIQKDDNWNCITPYNY